MAKVTAKDFDIYHAACERDGYKDGLCSDMRDEFTRAMPPLAYDYTRADVARACTTAVDTVLATWDDDDQDAWMEQQDLDECIPEIAWVRWLAGFRRGAIDAMIDAHA